MEQDSAPERENFPSGQSKHWIENPCIAEQGPLSGDGLQICIGLLVERMLGCIEINVLQGKNFRVNEIYLLVRVFWIKRTKGIADEFRNLCPVSIRAIWFRVTCA